jgi:glutathione S-transferase
MIHLYSFNTPNSYKVSIALEELGLPYETHPINLRQGEQAKPAFLALNPAGKVPVLRDDESGLVLAESNAILVYLAERARRLIPADGPARSLVLKWLFFQASSVGPMFGEQGHYTVLAKEKVPYAIDRYTTETRRISALLDSHLASREFFEGDYSIADIAHFGWLGFLRQVGVPFAEWPHLSAWLDRVGARPAVVRGMCVPLPAR